MNNADDHFEMCIAPNVPIQHYYCTTHTEFVVILEGLR